MLSRRQFCSTTFAAASALAAQGPRRKMNVLLIAVDDMRPELGCYGAKHVHTPNLDALAKIGTVFTRAYCQQAVCSPSRTSLLTGLRPDTTKVYDLQTHFRLNLPDAVTLRSVFASKATRPPASRRFSMTDSMTRAVGRFPCGGPVARRGIPPKVRTPPGTSTNACARAIGRSSPPFQTQVPVTNRRMSRTARSPMARPPFRRSPRCAHSRINPSSSPSVS